MAEIKNRLELEFALFDFLLVFSQIFGGGLGRCARTVLTEFYEGRTVRLGTVWYG